MSFSSNIRSSDSESESKVKKSSRKSRDVKRRVAMLSLGGIFLLVVSYSMLPEGHGTSHFRDGLNVAHQGKGELKRNAMATASAKANKIEVEAKKSTRIVVHNDDTIVTTSDRGHITILTNSRPQAVSSNNATSPDFEQKKKLRRNVGDAVVSKNKEINQEKQAKPEAKVHHKITVETMNDTMTLVTISKVGGGKQREKTAKESYIIPAVAAKKKNEKMAKKNV